MLVGLTVGVVVLPVALVFVVATGPGATAGIVTGIVAGVVASVFGGSSVQVSGPTGATAVVLVPIVAHDLFLDFGERTNVVLDKISV